jgi:hypothetical protein
MARMVKMVRETPTMMEFPHINLHAFWMTLGFLGARSSPLGVMLLSPKELRITGFISKTLII